MQDTPPSKPRLDFGRRSSSASAGPGRKHVPMDDVLARMAGKISERRRALDAARRPDGDALGETA